MGGEDDAVVGSEGGVVKQPRDNGDDEAARRGRGRKPFTVGDDDDAVVGSEGGVERKLRDNGDAPRHTTVVPEAQLHPPVRRNPAHRPMTVAMMMAMIAVVSVVMKRR